MAAKKNPLSEKAYEMYKQGMKLVDIAAELDVPPGTVRRWKSTRGWDSERSGSRSERSDKKRAEKKQVVDDGTKETLQNNDLTPEQQMFCIYYSRTFNATQSYINAYGCQYSTALTNGPALLGNTRIKNEIERLKEIKRQQIVAGADDIVELQMRIAFADIGNYLSFGREDVQIMGPFGPIKDPETKEYITKEVNAIRLADSGSVDTQIIQEVKQGKDGVSIKLADKQKAFDWLTKYFLMHPESKYRAEYEKRKAEKEGGETTEYESDGFMEALQGDVAATFKEDDAVET